MNWNEIFSSEKAQESEKLGSLSQDWLEVIYQQKWFKLFVPKSLDGLGLSLPEALKLEEKISQMDGSLGWTVTLCAGAGWFVGFLDESFQSEIFSDPKVCLAGSGFVGGKADLIGNEYVVSGHWTYASGALHATHLTANCEILENGKALLDKKGNPIVKAFILKRSEVEILDGWRYMGMIATGSHAFKTENVKVPSNRCFEIIPQKAKLKDSLYQYPFLQFAEATLAVNILGISQHLQSLISTSFWKRNESKRYSKKHLDYFEKLEKKTRSKLEKAKKKFYDQVKESWEELDKKGKISKNTLNSVSRTSRKLTQTCRELNGKMYPFAGLEAAKTETALNRVWRDFNTVSQHSLLIFPF